MSGKTIDEIANSIWVRGFNAARAMNDAEYRRGYQQALQDMAEWTPALVSEEVVPSPQSEPRLPDGRKRVLEWLRAQPHGAAHHEFRRANIAGDHAALRRLVKHGYARQDPESRRYYALESADA